MKIPIFPGTLPETNSLPLKMDGWNTTFLLGSRPIFRGKLAVSFRECNDLKNEKIPVTETIQGTPTSGRGSRYRCAPSLSYPVEKYPIGPFNAEMMDRLITAFIHRDHRGLV